MLEEVGAETTLPPELLAHVRTWEIAEYEKPWLVHHYRVVQPSADPEGKMGIVPTLCDIMLTKREAAKKQLKAEKKKVKAKAADADSTLVDNLDAVQNALKVVR